MAKYRKKPVVIEAEVYREGLEEAFFCNAEKCRCTRDEFLQPPMLCENCVDGRDRVPYINTLEGKMFIRPGDYIITGIKGERYPCKPDIFEATYELVAEGEDNEPISN